jgi:hypothetical protein
VAYGSDNSKELQIRLEVDRIGNSDLFTYNGLVYINHYRKYHPSDEDGHETAIVSFETFVEFMREAIPELVKREEAKRTPYRRMAITELKEHWTGTDSCGMVKCDELADWQFIIDNKAYKACKKHKSDLERLAQLYEGAKGGKSS